MSKSVLRNNSNSDKTNDYEVTFTWLQGGEHHSVYKKAAMKRLSLKSTNQSVTNLAAAREDVSCNKAASTLFANSKTEPKVANEMAIIPTTTNDSTIELMAMSTNNRISLLRNLTKAQMLTLIDDINQSMAQNREEDIEAVISLIRDKDLPLEVIISRMEAA